MSAKEILERALCLKPHEKSVIVDGLLKSLDVPDLELDDIWAQEAEQRLIAYREGSLKGISIEDLFKDVS